ncbi:pentapeptide repeat-containing protein, partial [Pseudonocardia oceani]|nr:hypothetical protein [Pseudonocardia oceani]
MDDRTTGDSPHGILLALAGRIDDDLLAWCRELVAVGEDGRALELITGTLVADGTALPPRERAAVAAAARSARTDLDADAVLPPAATAAGAPHRFDAGRGVEHLAAAVGALPERLVAGCRTWVTFRSTPAGSAPGPLPQPVVLVEVAADDQRPVDVLGYQLAIACARVGAPAAVEVVVAGAPRPEYQQAALRSALPVHGAPDAVVEDPEPVTPATGTPEVGPGSAWPSLGSLVMPPEAPAGRTSEDDLEPQAPSADETGHDRSDLHGSDLHGSDLHGSDLYGSDVHGSDAHSPTYAIPAYEIPAYEIPAYEIPAYEIPQYDPSAYEAPAASADRDVPDRDLPAHAEPAQGYEEQAPEAPAEPRDEPAHAAPVAERPAADEVTEPAGSADPAGSGARAEDGEPADDDRTDGGDGTDDGDRSDHGDRADDADRADHGDDLAPGDDLRPEDPDDGRDAPARGEEPSWDFGSPADQRTDPG